MAEEKGELSLGRKMVRGFCLFLIMLGIMLFLIWGLAFNIWWDIGLYTVLVLLFGFGIVGFALYSMPESDGETGPK
jgi:hypothetical protein